LLKTDEANVIWVSLMNLLLFGGGGIAYYILDKKENKNTIATKRNKIIALFFLCLFFVFASYSILPFNHLFDNTWRYIPTLGWIFGIVGILFFGFGVIVAIIQFCKYFKNNKDEL
jgi:uncharacterized ion transporter superfamily protein YfcC